jgi:hypothetical protein
MNRSALLLLQAPVLTEVRSSKVDSADGVFLKRSRSGKWLVWGRPHKLEDYTAPDLTPAQQFELPWTAVGWDEEDAHPEVVGKELIRKD